MTVDMRPLRHVADVLVSNVDKKTVEGEQPVRLCNYTDVYYQTRITADLEFMRATATAAQVKRFGLRAGDSILTKDSETAADIAVPAFVPVDLPDVVCGYHLAVIRPRPSAIDPAFLAWALQSEFMRDQFAARASGVTRYGLTYEAIQGAEVPGSMTTDAQRRIADFLDDQVARIDAAISLRRRAAQLAVEAQKSSLVEEFFNSSLPTVRLAQVARVSHGRQRSPENDSGPHMIPYVRSANVQDGFIDVSDLKEMNFDPRERSAYGLRPGDVLVTEASGSAESVGASALYEGQIDGTVCFQNHLLRLRPISSEWLADYLQWWARASHAAGAMRVWATGANILNLGSENLKRMPVPLRPPTEQDRVSRRCSDLVQRFLTLSGRCTESAELLEERKRALITAAVTGEFDVSSAGPRAAAAVTA